MVVTDRWTNGWMDGLTSTITISLRKAGDKLYRSPKRAIITIFRQPTFLYIGDIQHFYAALAIWHNILKMPLRFIRISPKTWFVYLCQLIVKWGIMGVKSSWQAPSLSFFQISQKWNTKPILIACKRSFLYCIYNVHTQIYRISTHKWFPVICLLTA